MASYAEHMELERSLQAVVTSVGAPEEKRALAEGRTREGQKETSIMRELQLKKELEDLDQMVGPQRTGK